MPNPRTGVAAPCTRKEILERLHDTLSKGEAVIGAGAGTGISAKFIEKGGAGVIIISIHSEIFAQAVARKLLSLIKIPRHFGVSQFKEGVSPTRTSPNASRKCGP